MRTVDQLRARGDRVVFRVCENCKIEFPAAVSGSQRLCSTKCMSGKFNGHYIHGKSRDWKRKYKIERHNSPEKVTARLLLQSEVIKGNIKRKPCEVCGILPTEGHHEDYSKPLEVRWLCKSHHMKLHHKLKKISKQKGI